MKDFQREYRKGKEPPMSILRDWDIDPRKKKLASCGGAIGCVYHFRPGALGKIFAEYADDHAKRRLYLFEIGKDEQGFSFRATSGDWSSEESEEERAVVKPTLGEIVRCAIAIIISKTVPVSARGEIEGDIQGLKKILEEALVIPE